MLTPLGPTDRRSVGPYRLRGRLGSGGMGTVYLGVSPDGQPVAVKVIRADLLDEPEFRGRFRREVSAAARVRGSCVAQVLDADLDADEPWMVTEYVEGANLMAAVTRGGPLRDANLVTLAVGLAEGLVAVHAANVMHRDLKPANILLSWEGPKIIDFGLARAEDLTSNTSTGDVIGTVAWMAPEQLNGDPATRATDVFTWGMCVAFAARGRHPFDAQTAAATAMRILSTEPALDDVPEDVLPAVTAALRRDPAQRPDAAALVAILTGQPVVDPVEAGPAAQRLLADWVPPGTTPGNAAGLALVNGGRSDVDAPIPAGRAGTVLEPASTAARAGGPVPLAGGASTPADGVGAALAGLVRALANPAAPAVVNPVDDPNETTSPLIRPPAAAGARAAGARAAGARAAAPRAGSERVDVIDGSAFALFSQPVDAAGSVAVSGADGRPAQREQAAASPVPVPAATPAAQPVPAPGKAVATVAAPRELGTRALRRRHRRRQRLLLLALVAAMLLIAALVARPLIDADGPGRGPTAAANGLDGQPMAGAPGPAGLGGPGGGPGRVNGAPGNTAGPSQLAANGTSLGTADVISVATPPSGPATAPLAQPSASGLPADAAPPPRTTIVSSNGGPVTVYLGPTTLSLFGGARGTVPSGTPVDVYCGVYAQQVTAGDTTTRLWLYTSSGWVPAGYVESGTSAPTGAPACVGTVSRPQLGSSAPRPDTGPFPVTQTVSILQIVGGVVGALTSALLGADPVGQLLGGSLVVLRCQQTDGNNTVWDQLLSGGWVQHSYIYSGTNGSPAPSC
ncbi:serine/threonine-protein kinase [Pseudofrankia sp. DC12]|uniref:serine/threonine-protein kinase n=1 Tax=Pseudofrankia sp. DC12 TaxID=683315 RepID=UPI0006967DFF|nr:serine/threonine-protein kinase [Pseudofrankia sp. DC12]